MVSKQVLSVFSVLQFEREITLRSQLSKDNDKLRINHRHSELHGSFAFPKPNMSDRSLQIFCITMSES